MAGLIQFDNDDTPLRDPVLIAGFAVRRRGGRLPSSALSYLVDKWHGKAVARLDPQDYYDFTVRRPMTRYSRRRRRNVIDWPEANIYRASPPGASRDFLMLVAFEPNFHWRDFVETLTGYLDAAGVRTAVNLRCVPGAVPHTRPAPVMVNASDPELEVQFGVQTMGHKYQGPADIGAVFGTHLESLRWQTADLVVQQPDYFPRMPNANASMALIRLIDRAFGTATPIDSLRETAESQMRLIEENLADGDQTRSAIEELERRYDAGLERMDFLAPEADDESVQLPSGQELIQEIERLLGGEQAP